MAIEIFDILRAKSPDETGRAESLKEHLQNCLEQVVVLHNVVKSMESSIELQLFKDKNLMKNFFKSLAKAAILHDFGKIDYGFQRMVFTREEKENSEDFQKIRNFFKGFTDINFTRHEVLSTIFASILLKTEDIENKWHNKIITAILFHHYNKYYTELRNFPEFIFDDLLLKIIKYFKFIERHKNDFETSYLNLLENFTQEFYKHDFMLETINELKKDTDWDKISRARKKLEEDEDDLSDFTWFYVPPNIMGKEISQFEEELLYFLLLLGALRRTDYASSGKVNVEAKRISEGFDFGCLLQKIGQKIKDKNSKSVFWQKRYFDENKTPAKKLILIAPTGSGKTEFSILWGAKQGRKFLYTIPLRVALNDLYARFKGETEKGYFEREYIDILHSTSFIEYLKEEGSRSLDIESKITSAKLLSLPIMLTTPDQIFLTSLNYYGSDKIIAVYPMSSIVIDEIQTYNPEMAAVLIRTLQLVNSLGGNVLVMTATFPPYFEKYFNQMSFSTFDTTTSELKEEIKNLNIKRHKIKVIKENIFEYDNLAKKDESLKVKQESFKEIKKRIEEKKNILIVLNNVKKAIKLFNKLLEQDNNLKDSLFLLHSRIIEKYKSIRIEEIKKRLKNNKRVILIATQVVEASVDLDFDFMITEISTIDSQVQRWGRVYRSREHDYRYYEANILVFIGNKDENGKIEFDRGTTAVYSRDVLEKTGVVLLKYQGDYLSYEKEKQMVNETFDNELKEKFTVEIDKTLEFLNYYTASKKSEAQRIFRNIAGITAVVPALMKVEAQGGDKWLKTFAEIIEGKKKNESSKDWTWKEIIEELKKVGFPRPERESKWYLRGKMYEYSVNVPAYKKDLSSRLSHEFKGFWVLKVNEKEIGDLQKFGLDILEGFKNIEEEIESQII